ncbi:hypothetical protein [Leptolyngbya sp. FACHB-711]|nr:hypothetical protein [Leptolyngbya sp. FACHB-711]MBD1850398.1 hypothetical protein [Cyanobacteria bacterium FACHB-502]MBD2026061.1 hypothetical protein [Leptolyngbya sp. FACHB-711]
MKVSVIYIRARSVGVGQGIVRITGFVGSRGAEEQAGEKGEGRSLALSV